MPSGTPVKPTPEEVAKHGHIAAAIRKWLADHDARYPDLARELGWKNIRHLSQIYKWGGAKQAPGPMFRGKLAKVLGVEEDYLLPRKDGETRLPPVPNIPTAHPTYRKPDGGPVLQFAVAADGEARIRFDITLPIAQAMPLLRVLLDAGLLIGEGAASHG